MRLEEETIHVRHFDFIVIEKDQLSDTAPSQHFCGDKKGVSKLNEPIENYSIETPVRANTANTNDDYGFSTNVLVVFHDAHSLKSHQP